MYLAEIDGLLVDNIFLYKAFFLEIDVSKPLVNQGLLKERVSFLEANLRGACWSYMLLNIRIKLLQVMLMSLFFGCESQDKKGQC